MTTKFYVEQKLVFLYLYIFLTKFAMHNISVIYLKQSGEINKFLCKTNYNIINLATIRLILFFKKLIFIFYIFISI